ncbi:MAG: hypothetical protein D6689_10350 [Deltaproteobacteria bacterium]|nr:MAG: hypothetical protein D6689_10350 [Deltaproteobacteria bacterium]
MAAVAMAACEPEIGPGTYFCGPEMLCPPDLSCDPLTYTCERPAAVRPFACPEGTEADEPNEDADAATPLGRLACGGAGAVTNGCIARSGDVDVYAFKLDECLAPGARLLVSARFPIAMAPLSVQVRDAAGEIVTTAQLCTPDPDFTGTERVCAELPKGPAAYTVSVQLAGGGDCAGACAYNLYELRAEYLVN